MKRLVFFSLCLLNSSFITPLYSQNNQDNETSLLNLEFIFSKSSLPNSKVRFSGFPNINYPIYILIGRNNPYPIYTGVNVRNIGLIQKDSLTYKARAITVGVPIKFYVIKKPVVLLGAELDYALMFKEKILRSSGKEEHTEFFSDKINAFQPAVTTEIFFSKDLKLKASYYLRNFYNKDFGGVGINRDQGDSNIFYISAVWGIFFATASPPIIRLL